jgi:hypothetical protein
MLSPHETQSNLCWYFRLFREQRPHLKHICDVEFATRSQPRPKTASTWRSDRLPKFGPDDGLGMTRTRDKFLERNVDEFYEKTKVTCIIFRLQRVGLRLLFFEMLGERPNSCLGKAIQVRAGGRWAKKSAVVVRLRDRRRRSTVSQYERCWDGFVTAGSGPSCEGYGTTRCLRGYPAITFRHPHNPWVAGLSAACPGATPRTMASCIRGRGRRRRLFPDRLLATVKSQSHFALANEERSLPRLRGRRGKCDIDRPAPLAVAELPGTTDDLVGEMVSQT